MAQDLTDRSGPSSNRWLPPAAQAGRWPGASLARFARRVKRHPWILRTGAQWAELPRRYPPYQTAIAASSSGNGPASWSG